MKAFGADPFEPQSFAKFDAVEEVGGGSLTVAHQKKRDRFIDDIV